VVPNGYGSPINEGSTDGSTRSQSGQWVDVGKPMLYLLNRGAGVVEMNRQCRDLWRRSSSAVRVISSHRWLTASLQSRLLSRNRR
jgi:hypothetical protein